MSLEACSLYFEYDYPKTIVLENINFKIETGEVVALMGTSGSGKSTLIDIISSFSKPTSGKFLINGEKVRINHPFKSLAYVSQSSIKTLFPWLSVEDNLYYPNKLRKQLDKSTKNYCDNLLNKLGIEHRRKYFPLKLSGGEQKRLSLAVALSYKPDIILLDEPFSGIDFKLSEELWDFLYLDFKSRKPTVLFVTHSLTEATILADRVIFLDKSKCVSKPDKKAVDFRISDTTPRYKIITDPSTVLYEQYILENFNQSMNNE